MSKHVLHQDIWVLSVVSVIRQRHVFQDCNVLFEEQQCSIETVHFEVFLLLSRNFMIECLVDQLEVWNLHQLSNGCQVELYLAFFLFAGEVACLLKFLSGHHQGPLANYEVVYLVFLLHSRFLLVNAVENQLLEAGEVLIQKLLAVTLHLLFYGCRVIGVQQRDQELHYEFLTFYYT